MQLRRALLLLAVVLGLAALAASLARQRDDERGAPRVPATERRTPTATPGPAPARPARLRFPAGGRPRTAELAAGRPAVLTVEVERPGRVNIPGLGLSAPSEPLTPASFDVLVRRPARYELRFTPAGAEEGSLAGTLSVTAAR